MGQSADRRVPGTLTLIPGPTFCAATSRWAQAKVRSDSQIGFQHNSLKPICIALKVLSRRRNFHCSNNRIAPEFPHIKCSSEQFLWNQDRLGFDSGFRDVLIESRTFLKRKGLNRRRRKSASLYAGGESAKNFGGFLETELERIDPKQP